jgi:anti-sigma regulatory factor (Ser/Thr protein kinase)
MTGKARRRGPPGRRSPGEGQAGGGQTGGRQTTRRQKGTGPGAEELPTLDQVFDGDSLYALRATVAARGTRAGLAKERVDDLVLAVHELAANAVRHGAGRGRLRIWTADGALRCEVTDDGARHANDAAAAADPAQWNIEPGHGLWVVRQVADQTSLRGGPSGTVVAVSFILGPPA